jgi:hypothetical protein
VNPRGEADLSHHSRALAQGRRERSIIRGVMFALPLLLSVLVLGVVGCGGDGKQSSPETGPAVELPSPPGIGPSARYRPHAASSAVAAARPVGPFRCERSSNDTFGAHLEIFANRHGVLIPAGIGVAPPLVRKGAYVRGGRCRYALRTFEPTGLIEIEEGSRATLGDFFDLWDQPLSPRRVAGFRAKRGEKVAAYVNGRRWRGDARSIPLARHAAIVLHVGGHVRLYGPFHFPQDL